MPLYEIHQTVTRMILAYSESPPHEHLMDLWLDDAEMIGGDTMIENEVHAVPVSVVPGDWEGALVWHEGGGELTAEQALKLP